MQPQDKRKSVKPSLLITPLGSWLNPHQRLHDTYYHAPDQIILIRTQENLRLCVYLQPGYKGQPRFARTSRTFSQPPPSSVPINFQPKSHHQTFSVPVCLPGLYESTPDSPTNNLSSTSQPIYDLDTTSLASDDALHSSDNSVSTTESASTSESESMVSTSSSCSSLIPIPHTAPITPQHGQAPSNPPFSQEIRSFQTMTPGATRPSFQNSTHKLLLTNSTPIPAFTTLSTHQPYPILCYSSPAPPML